MAERASGPGRGRGRRGVPAVFGFVHEPSGETFLWREGEVETDVVRIGLLLARKAPLEEVVE